ncbi:MAG: HRDC domain-containing protein [Pirellulales bacterium]
MDLCETEAKRRNQPARRILRDDLLVEIAKRRSPDPKQIQATRGMERSDLHKIMPDMVRAVETALAIKEEDLPRQTKQAYQQQYTLLGQFLSTALSSICRSQNVAASLVGTASDVRDLIAFRLGDAVDERPVLASGWREQVVGQLIEDLLEGKVRVHVENPKSEDPLRFEPM